MTENTNTNETTQEQSKQSDQEFNFAQLRKKAETAERERQAAIQKASTLEKELETLRKRNEPTVDDEDGDESEPYVDYRRLNKKLKGFEERFEKKVDERAEAKARYLMEQERQNIFLKQNPDFSEILQPAILQKFADKHPDIAEQMLEMPDNFARQKLLYQNIKAFGIHKKEEPQQSIQETIDKNKRSPYYQPSGIGTAPYSSGGDFSPSGQKSAYNKMQELKQKLRI